MWEWYGMKWQEWHKKWQAWWPEQDSEFTPQL